LRGDAEKADLDPAYLDALFSKLDGVCNITFTGGEPSLVPEVINQTIEAAKRHGVSISDFYIATNAVKIPNTFLIAIMGLWCYCDGNELSTVNWSNDPFHGNQSAEEVKKLSAFSFASAKYSEEHPSTSLILEGRAEDLASGRYDRANSQEHFELDENQISEGNIYLNCEGNIIAGCDWSFESQRDPDNIICSVEDFSLEAVTNFTEAS
jgi:hypothetical protein